MCAGCGAFNRDDNNFCNSCGASEFRPMAENTTNPNAAPVLPPPPPTPTYIQPKPEFTKYDLFTIFGFVAGIVGCFVISLILHPLSIAASIAGFARGKRYRGLAIAAVIIAVIGLLIRLFLTLYETGNIPHWLITGAFDN